jgi:hypothetical protein
MAVNKAHDEFYALDLEHGWEVPAGYPSGIQQKILSGSLDEANKRGCRTRLLRFGPGVFTTQPFVHDYWEEVFLVSGDLTVGNDADGRGGTKFEAFTYACRPPGAYHGPFRSERGCLLYESTITTRRDGRRARPGQTRPGRQDLDCDDHQPQRGPTPMPTPNPGPQTPTPGP